MSARRSPPCPGRSSAAKVRILATQLRKLGVKPGDRVVAYMPNIPETVIAMLATTSIGAIWTSCGPDFGTRGVLDRFTQLAPKVLFYVDGYQYGGKPFNRKDRGPQDHRPAGLARAGRLPALPESRRSGAVSSAHGVVGRPAEQPAGAGRRIQIRAGAVRASAVDPVFLGHDRVAEAHLPQPRRHHSRAVEARAIQLRRGRATGCSSSPPPAG